MITYFLLVLTGIGVAYPAGALGLLGWRLQFLFSHLESYDSAADNFLGAYLDNLKSAKQEARHILLTNKQGNSVSVRTSNKYYAYASEIGPYRGVRVGLRNAARLKSLQEKCASNFGTWEAEQ